MNYWEDDDETPAQRKAREKREERERQEDRKRKRGDE